MQFTPQQLTGGPKFHHKTRIGNWSEDLELEEIKLKDYLKQKETGTLKVTAKQQQLEESLAPEELSDSPDGLLRFGHKVMVVSQQTKYFLGVNPFDKVEKQYPAWTATTGPAEGATVRNVFVVERVKEDDGFTDDIVHYGQDIRLKLQPFSKISTPAYLHSEPVTALAAAKFSRHQEVTAIGAPIGETKWQILWPDVSMRMDMDRSEVMANGPMVLKHVMTGSFLASDQIPYANLFGSEREVHCYHYYSLGKTQNLTSEKKGDITGDDDLRKHGLQNIWSICTKARDVPVGEEVAQ